MTQQERYYVKRIGAGWCVCDLEGIKSGEIIYVSRHQEEAEAALKRLKESAQPRNHE